MRALTSEGEQQSNHVERALLSFGYGRWSRIKEAAQGGTRLRGDDELERFGTAFVCLCVGVPIASVGGPETISGEAEADGIAKAREMLRVLGGKTALPRPCQLQGSC